MIHHRNIQTLATEIYKTLNNLNPIFMREIFSSKTHNYSIRTQNLTYPNQIWKSIPKEIQECDDLRSFKSYVSNNCKNLCKCNSCKMYIPNLGYIEHTSRQYPPP